MAAEDAPEAPSTAPESAPEGDSAAPASDKHPLENKWTLWHDPGQQGGKTHQHDYGQQMDRVYTFDTVEDFWCLFNNIKPPSWLPQRTDLHLFKDGIKPAWEDPQNEKGGSWTYALPKGAPGEQLDKIWLDALLASIGESFTEGDDMCGMSVNIRGKPRLNVWTRTAANESKQISIGKELKSALGLDASSKIGYSVHADSLAGISKEKYMV